jgi:Na+-transporting NADH:ubiquinone oxidoreductase subunit A
MNTIRLIKGHSLKITGAPSPTLIPVKTPLRVALIPEKIRFIKPRLKVREGDRTRVGSALLEDKRNPDVKFLSPGGGTVSEIRYGPRRVIEAVVIDLDDEETYEEFPSLTDDDLAAISRKELVDMIIRGGLWPLFRELPYRDMPRQDVVPPSIYVYLDNLEPFHPLPEIYLDGREKLLAFGLAVLRRLSRDSVIVTCCRDRLDGLPGLGKLITHVCRGNYPAHDPGVLLYRTQTSASDHHAWFIKAQDLLMVAELLQSGRFPTQRVVVLAGPAAPGGTHLLTRLGVPLADLLEQHTVFENVRLIVGGCLTGYQGNRDTYLGLSETSLLLLSERGKKGTVFDWMMPGYDMPSYSRTFLSALNRSDLEMNCRQHGGLRACIACNHCADVCPVDILPQLAYKAVLAGEVEESLAHGLLDCVECGLCSYVCPSKIELSQTLQQAREDFYREMSKP